MHLKSKNKNKTNEIPLLIEKTAESNTEWQSEIPRSSFIALVDLSHGVESDWLIKALDRSLIGWP